MRKLILIILILSTSSINAQQLLSLEEAISYGLQHNYNIQIVENQNKIADVIGVSTTTVNNWAKAVRDDEWPPSKKISKPPKRDFIP